MIIELETGHRLEVPDGSTPDKIDEVIGHFSNQQSQQSTPEIGVGEDVARSVGSNLVGGGIDLAMTLPNIVNQIAAGPQLLGRGIADTISPLLGAEPQPRGKLWQPLFGSSDVESAIRTAYDPQTIAGKAVVLPIRIAGGIVGAKGLQAAGNSKFALDETSGKQVSTPNKNLPSGMENLDVLPEASKGTTFAKKVNPLEVGIEANQKISKQYGADTEMQRNLYADLNQKGKVFSIKAPDLYSKLDDMVGYLENKVAVDTPEYRAYTELKEFRDNLSNKYGIESTPNKISPIVDENGAPIITQGKQGVNAYGIEPSDLVDLKTTINSGLKPNKFSTAGNSKILQFKKYVQNGLDEASGLSPEFATALKNAEKQAARVGMYREDSLKPLWQPEDYVAWKSGGEIPADTQTRAAKFLENVNNRALGRASSISKILPKEDTQSILKAAIKHGKQTRPNIPAATMMAISGHPLAALRTGLSSMVNNQISPLEELAANIKNLQRPPIPQRPVNPQNVSGMGAMAPLFDITKLLQN